MCEAFSEKVHPQTEKSWKEFGLRTNHLPARVMQHHHCCECLSLKAHLDGTESMRAAKTLRLDTCAACSETLDEMEDLWQCLGISGLNLEKLRTQQVPIRVMKVAKQHSAGQTAPRMRLNSF